MSTQKEFLEDNVRVGFVGEHGPAWWNANGLAAASHFEGAVPVEEARKLFDWRPVKVTLMEELEDGSAMPLRDWKGNTSVAVKNPRNNAMMGVFGESYPDTSYQERLLDGLETLLDTPDLSIGSVGLLDGGSKAWVQIEQPETLEHLSGEKLRPYLVAFSSLDGSIANTFKEGMTRIVCDNTFALFQSEKTRQYKYRNSSAQNGFNVTTARQALDLLVKSTDQMVKTMETMLTTKVTAAQWDRFLSMVVPVADDASQTAKTRAENKRIEIGALYTSDSRVSDYTGTAWGAFQAISTYNQHERTVRKGDNEFQRNVRMNMTGKTDQEDWTTLSQLSEVTERQLVAMV